METVFTINIISLIALIGGLFSVAKFIMNKVDERLALKADKDRIAEVNNALTHITERVDKIYDHLISAGINKNLKD